MRQSLRHGSINQPAHDQPVGRASKPAHNLSILHLQRTIGNRATVRHLQRAVGDESAESSVDDPALAANRDAWDQIVAEELERFLQSYMNIPVRVVYEEDGQPMQTFVHVHPPYFMNKSADSAGNTLKRYNKAMENREKASLTDKRAYGSAGGKAKVGKAERERLQKILETAVAKGAIPISPGEKYPSAENMRAWLVKYGIGVDCSAFVAQSLNQLMSHMAMLTGTESTDAFSGSGAQLNPRQDTLTQIDTPAELRPGTLQHVPGHIRIVMTVERAGSEIIFTTAESTAGAGTIQDDPDGKKMRDIGPRRARWKYSDATKSFSSQWLQIDNGDGTWKKVDSAPKYTRVKAMNEFQDANAAPEGPVDVFDFSEEADQVYGTAEQMVNKANQTPVQ